MTSNKVEKKVECDDPKQVKMDGSLEAGEKRKRNGGEYQVGEKAKKSKAAHGCGLLASAAEMAHIAQHRIEEIESAMADVEILTDNVQKFRVERNIEPGQSIGEFLEREASGWKLEKWPCARVTKSSMPSVFKVFGGVFYPGPSLALVFETEELEPGLELGEERATLLALYTVPATDDLKERAKKFHKVVQMGNTLRVAAAWEELAAAIEEEAKKFD